MFEEGNILYFEPFHFENGNTPKPKYFLVLKKLHEQVVLASLPTSHDHIPASFPKVHGCIEEAAINFNCYYFQADKPIARNEATAQDFAFPKDTYIYGYRIARFDVAAFISQMENQLTTVTLKGRLFPNEYRALTDCLKHSAAVKRIFKKLL